MKFPLLYRLLLLFVLLYFAQLIVTSIFIYHKSIEDSKNTLLQLVDDVQNGITYKNGKYNLSKYLADPQIPGRFRLYIFTSDGYVIERWRPIPGFLDVSNFQYLLSFKNPETLNTVTNENWRIYSLPIRDNREKTVGVIAVSSYSPNESELSRIDDMLVKTAQAIRNKITINNGTIVIKNVDVKLLPFNVPFQVVDQYNKILLKTNNITNIDRIPNFIDPSYVKSEMKGQSVKLRQNTFNGEPFLIASKTLLNDNQPIGVVVAAWTLSLQHDLIYNYLLLDIITGIVLTLIFGIFTAHLLKSQINTSTPNLLTSREIEKIIFSKSDGILLINAHKINFSYATNQYYLCQTLFSSPSKKWENDELLEKFGEDLSKNGWRKVYDAMIAINLKTSEIMEEKLIIINNKTYQINPRLVPKIEKI